MYTEHSPTEDMFNYLTDIWNPDLKVKELKMKLRTIYRNDVIDSLIKGIGFMWFFILPVKWRKLLITHHLRAILVFSFGGGGGGIKYWF